MVRSPRWKGDIVLRGSERAFGVSTEAAGELLAELSTHHAETLCNAISTLIGSGTAEELEALRDYLMRPGNVEPETFEYTPKEITKQLRLELTPQTPERGYRLAESKLNPLGHGPAMTLSIQAEDLDGSYWGRETGDEASGIAAIHAILPLITERKPLSWLLADLDHITSERGST